jgi:GNAT superfamily N-acetyltransferase
MLGVRAKVAEIHGLILKSGAGSPIRSKYVGMTSVTIRSYRPSDHSAGRQLWGELTREHSELYGDGSAAAGPGEGEAAFEEYLTRLDLSGVWVAEHPDDDVIGLIGMIMKGRVGEVEPVVVTARHRGQGIGRRLLDHVAEQARGRGLTSLTISPASRNVEAIRCLHAAGYDVLSSIELTMDLGPRHGQWQDGPALHDLKFRA